MIGKNILFVLLNKAIKQDSGGSGIDGSYAKLDYAGMTNANIKYAIREISDIDLSVQTTCASAFSGFGNLEKIGKVKTSGSVTNMSSMFSDCAKLTSINLSEMVTSNVTNMSNMFQYDTNITSIDLSSFNTSKVTNMSYMFASCTNLSTITFGNDFSMEKCTSSSSLQNMFMLSPNINNNSLNSLLGVLLTYAGTQNKNLKWLGLTSSQATTCTTLSNWSALASAGWTTGY